MPATMPGMRLLPFLIAASILTGCACGGRPMPIPTLAPIPMIPRLPMPLPPPSLTAACPELPQPSGAGLPELLVNHIAVAQSYHECRDRQMGLADWVLTNE